MTVERMFDLVTDCLVCMGFSFLRFGFYFGFFGVFIVVPVHVRKRKGRLKPATTAQFFLIASGRDVKIPLSVLDLAPSSSLHDDARIHATRGHPTARRLERRRRGSAGEVVSTGATGIAPTRPSLRRERAAHTLQTTAILNEAYLRLVDLRSSSYFFLPMRAANRSLSFPRARASRDMTVPAGICAMSAIPL